MEEEEKAKDFLISQIEKQDSHAVELTIELYDYFYDYDDTESIGKYEPVIQNFMHHGNPEKLQSAHSAYILARRCLEQNEAQKALAFAQRAYFLNPLQRGYVNIHCEALIALGLYREAEPLATAAHELDSHHLLIHSPLAEILKVTRNFSKLERIGKESYEKTRAFRGLAASFYADCLILSGKTGQAISVLKESLASSKEEWERVHLVVRLAQAYCQQGSFSDAQSALQEEQSHSADPRLRLEVANVLARAGELQASVALLETLHNMPQ
ncbi:hypothetical protein LO772_24460 [Yinghuangia sp. ASG 101]|uniref:tetratricopeptide repeat protein n=1 Tax=Yinghuangia sp. ASG 101 TaxID=2896848 RepID=UPI001E43EB0D|nr:hypothetical protein [Yinghuangia sp. ASG 101]UGQ10022.1 hypothetical protein LO772_24460 [Yinghuangia sp. ASG 101]